MKKNDPAERCHLDLNRTIVRCEPPGTLDLTIRAMGKGSCVTVQYDPDFIRSANPLPESTVDRMFTPAATGMKWDLFRTLCVDQSRSDAKFMVDALKSRVASRMQMPASNLDTFLHENDICIEAKGNRNRLAMDFEYFALTVKIPGRGITELPAMKEVVVVTRLTLMDAVRCDIAVQSTDSDIRGVKGGKGHKDVRFLISIPSGGAYYIVAERRSAPKIRKTKEILNIPVQWISAIKPIRSCENEMAAGAIRNQSEMIIHGCEKVGLFTIADSTPAVVANVFNLPGYGQATQFKSGVWNAKQKSAAFRTEIPIVQRRNPDEFRSSL